MTCREEHTESKSAVELIAERGLEGLSDALSLLINEAMRLERERHIQASPYERSDQRRGYANGYKPKTVRSRMGEITLAVPQVREGGFYPQSLDKGLRSERALKLALAEMYVSGVSTRKVAKVTQQLCGFDVSSSEVSRCAGLSNILPVNLLLDRFTDVNNSYEDDRDNNDSASVSRTPR